MTQSPTTDTKQILEKLSSERVQRLRKNVQLLFIGLSADETDPIIRLLRASRLAPRGHQVRTEEEFLQALSERSWDVILCPIDRHDTFSAKNALYHLRRLNKDIPVIQLLPTTDSQHILQAMRSNIQAVVPLEEKQLLILYIRRELENLEHRRKLRYTQGLLSDLEMRAQRLMTSSTDAIACCDGETIVFANNSFASLFGFDSGSTMLDTPLSYYMDTSVQEDTRNHLNNFFEQTPNGATVQLLAVRSDETTFSAQLNLESARYNYKDIIQITLIPEKQREDQLLSDKLDLVSGVYNADHFNSELDTVVRRALDGGADCHLLYISLDNFLEIRADVGIDGCDQVTRDIGTLLKKHVNKAHLIGRPEEDSFAIIFRDPTPDKAEALAEKLCKVIEGNLSESSGTTIESTASIGILTISDNSPSRKEVLRRARSAADLLRAQNQKGNGYLLFMQDAPLDDEESSVIKELEDAIQHSKLQLLFQPIVTLTHHSEINNYEVLLRLKKEDGSLVSPGDFLQIIDQADITIKLDRWVMKESLINLQREAKSGQKYRLFISISNRTLQDRKTLVWFSELLRRSGLPADQVVFQISETDASAYLKYASSFAEMATQLHCGVCIKHYGSSVNSDLVLKQIQAKIIKLDGSYIQELAEDNSQEKAFLELVTKLKSNDKLVIAPLVENTKVMGTLWKAGVHFVQGNYLQPPRDNMNYDFFEQ